MSDFSKAKHHFEEAKHCLPGGGVDVECSIGFGDIAAEEANVALAKSYYQDAITTARQRGHLGFEAYAHLKIGEFLLSSNEYAKARRHLITMLAIARMIGSLEDTAAALVGLSKIILEDEKSDIVTVDVLVDVALGIYRRIGAKRGIGCCLVLRGTICEIAGDDENAKHKYIEALNWYSMGGDQKGVDLCTRWLGDHK